MLWRSEVKKLLLVRKGLLLLLLCLLGKILFLGIFPEMKDPRISLSQSQYNKYLQKLHGESTPEKNDQVKYEYEQYLETIDLRETMEQKHKKLEISEEEYEEYAKELEQAFLRKNAAEIFSEKAIQFDAQATDLPPAHYIYEYGWQTIFSLQQFPDIFLLAGLLILAAQSFTSEAAAGILPILLCAKNGRTHLFFAKLCSLLLVGLIAALAFGGVEVLILSLRGWCNDPQAPIYSVSVMTECQLPLSLGDAYLMTLFLRAFTALLFSAVVYGLSVWIKSPVNTVFAGMCLLVLPLFFGNHVMMFTHGGLLCATRVLNALEQGWFAAVPFTIIAAYSVGIVILAGNRYRRGL